MIPSGIKIFCLTFILLPIFLTGQENSLDQFKTTKSVGEPPKIFKETFEERIEDSKGKVTEVEEKYKDDFVRYSNYSLRNLLKSGYILYGDPMTNFVQSVGNKLLSNHPDLKNEIQFYVIKNNITNALCTEPGVIFITTGLLSQIENEAQLAYVIAHEIVHYQEKHLQKSFNKSKESDLNASTSYQDQVTLSKDHEFEADVNALRLYHAAGYSEKEVHTVFDVLMYSYLTFDEIEIDSTFFGNPTIHIPQSYFPEKANPILAFEDYDDAKSTHPNIRKRKDSISSAIRKYDNWGTHKNFIDLEDFHHIQNIARFETVRENLILSNFIEALYEIYILEKQFPNNEYLQTTKAMVWTAMSQVSIYGRKNSYLTGIKEKEGSISLLYGFFKKLDQSEVSLLAVRMVEDIHLKFPDSKIIKNIRDESIKSLAHVGKLKINRLEKISYNEAIALRDNRDTSSVEVDSLNIENETKYDRIRKIREQQSSSQSEAELIDENFSTFLLYDLVSNRQFNDLYEGEKKAIEEETEERKTSKRKKDKAEKIQGEIILLNPHLEARDKKNKFDLDLTLKFYELLQNSIEEQAPEGRIHYKSIELSNDFTTEAYNEACLLNDYILQLAKSKNGSFKLYSVDYSEMERFINKYENPYLLLILGKVQKYSSVRNNLSGTARYVELSTGKITDANHYSVNLKLRKVAVDGLIFEAFSKF